MHKSLLTIVTLTAAALPVWAMGQGASADANGDGMLSVEEVQAAYPDVSTDSFLEMDADGDGLLNPDEIAAATEAGMLPADDAG